MTTSEELYVWTWLPGQTEPVERTTDLEMRRRPSEAHARNHAVLWDGTHCELTPTYALTPGQRSGDTVAQAMAHGRGDSGERVSNFAALVRESETFLLNAAEGSASDEPQLHDKQVLPRAAFFDFEPAPL